VLSIDPKPAELEAELGLTEPPARVAKPRFDTPSTPLALDPLPKVIWMQLSVRNDAAAARAEARGVTVIMNRCPKIEYGRLSGEIGWAGVNSGRISSVRPKLSPKGVQNHLIED
jgi:hypothetical protein